VIKIAGTTTMGQTEVMSPCSMKGEGRKNYLNKFQGLFLSFIVVVLGVALLFPKNLFVVASLTPTEANVIALVSGSEAYSYDLKLESIGLSHYAFRSAGSAGANEAADWIVNQFKSFGLEAWLEPFEFTNWTPLDKPSLIVDDDGNPSTYPDQVVISSFQCEHCSWPTSESGAFADLVILPLPAAANRDEIGLNPINMTKWNAVNTTGKVVLIGREVRWSYSWEQTYKTKLSEQPPAAVVYTWWYDWMSFTPPFHSSGGGYPFSSLGTYYWDLGIPVGFANYEDGVWIRNRESAVNVSAYVSIKSVIDVGTHYNVVGKINGYKNPEKVVIISGHYDTVMCGGFCDNGAGAAGVIEAAKVFSDAIKRQNYKFSYTLLFIAFADEELGLVGSTNYVEQHKSEMENIVAVINLDCIGSDELCVTETEPHNGLDLDEFILDAAQDLGIAATLIAPGGSDQESFRNPIIPDATPVNSSAWLFSRPLFYSDKWRMGTPGWIHTSYDNSTSTETLKWVEAEDLEGHIKVAALTIMRVSPSSLLTDLNRDGIVDIMDVSMVARAFGTKPGDKNWNAIADLDKNGVINIMDVAIVAKDYGKTLISIKD